MRLYRYALALLLLGALGLPWLLARNPNEREVEPRANAQDTDDLTKPDSKIWALHFRFKDPRLISVDIPGRGRRLCWYLWYQVINRTGEPRTFIPDFELVTLDKNTVHHDQVLPKVQEAIRQVEDPTGYLHIKNSVTIAAEPIMPSKPEAEPKAVTGVAIWDDVNPDTTRFDIFVSGLSNGWALTDALGNDPAPVVRRKTLELDFKRLGDRYTLDAREIQFLPPAKWIYRGSNMKVPALPGMKKADKPMDRPEPPQ